MGGNASDESAEMYFRGINVSNTEKFHVKSSLKNDQNFLNQSAFRFFDKDQSQNINCEEVKVMHDDGKKSLKVRKDALLMNKFIKKFTGKELGRGSAAFKPSKAANNNNANNNAKSTADNAARSQSVPDAPQTPEEVKKKSSCCLLIQFYLFIIINIKY